jgi:hypothetical protein
MRAPAGDIREAKDGFLADTVVGLQPFDNTANYAVTSDEGKGQDNICHVDGNLLLAPKDMLGRYIRNCVLNVLANIPQIVLSPLPRS